MVTMLKPQRRNNQIVIALVAKITKGKTGFGRIGRPDTRLIQIQPVFAMERYLAVVQQLRIKAVHMRHLRTLLTGI